MDLTSLQSAETQILPSGEFLFFQGTESDSFYVLKEGSLEVIVNDIKNGSVPGLTTILTSGKRVSIIKPGSTVGELGCLRNQPRNASIRALSDATLIRVPASRLELIQFLNQNPSVSIFLSQILSQRLMDGQTRFNQINSFLVSLQRLIDNLSLINYYYTNKFPMKDVSFEKTPFYRRAKKIDAMLREAGILFDDPDTSFLDRCLDMELSVSYGVPEDEGFFLSGKPLVSLLNKCLSMNVPELKSYFEEENRDLVQIVLFLAEKFSLIDEQLYKISVRTDNSLRILGHAEKGILKHSVDLFLALRETGSPGLHNFANLLQAELDKWENIQADFVELWGKTVPNLLIKTPRLHQDLLDVLEPAETDQDVDSIPEDKEDTADTAEIEELSVPDINPLALICDLGILSGSDEERLNKLLDEYKNLPDRHDTEPKTRALKKSISGLYWTLFFKVWEHCHTAGNVPLDFRYLFRYGLLDRSLISDEILARLPVPQKHKQGKVPIFFADEWVDYIHSAKEPPSTTEFGLNYEEYLEEEKRNLRRGDHLSLSKHHVAQFEIENMIQSAARMCSGSLGLDFPILDEVNIRPETLERNLLTPEIFEKNLLALLKIDYSIFYREVRYILEGKGQYFYKEILPNIIILPAVGSKGIPWQDIIGNKRNSRGRIVFPHIILEDFGEVLLNTIAHFRWELGKSMAGYNWANPVEGGLTGKYNDYIQFYKKNSNLSQEQKDLLKSLFTKYRTIQERFAYDYNLWIKFEKDGILKLNKVTREIFVDSVPFSKPIRDRLANIPAFERFIRIDENKRKKKIQILENRLKRLKNEGQDVDHMFEESFKYYKS